jgi:hypothetical protein
VEEQMNLLLVIALTQLMAFGVQHGPICGRTLHQKLEDQNS